MKLTLVFLLLTGTIFQIAQSQTIENVESYVASDANGVWNWSKGLSYSMYNSASNGLGWIKDKLSDVPSDIGNAASATYGSIKNAASYTGSLIGNAASSTKTEAENVASYTGSLVENAASSTKTEAENVASYTGETISDATQPVNSYA